MSCINNQISKAQSGSLKRHLNFLWQRTPPLHSGACLSLDHGLMKFSSLSCMPLMTLGSNLGGLSPVNRNRKVIHRS